MTQRKQEESMEKKHQFRDPKHKWVKLSPRLFVNHLVAAVVNTANVLQEVERLVKGRQVTRVEVVPHQWEWDENLLSVGVALETNRGASCRLFSLGGEVGNGGKRLVPFEGLVTI